MFLFRDFHGRVALVPGFATGRGWFQSLGKVGSKQDKLSCRPKFFSLPFQRAAAPLPSSPKNRENGQGASREDSATHLSLYTRFEQGTRPKGGRVPISSAMKSVSTRGRSQCRMQNTLHSWMPTPPSRCFGHRHNKAVNRANPGRVRTHDTKRVEIQGWSVWSSDQDSRRQGAPHHAAAPCTVAFG